MCIVFLKVIALLPEARPAGEPCMIIQGFHHLELARAASAAPSATRPTRRKARAKTRSCPLVTKGSPSRPDMNIVTKLNYPLERESSVEIDELLYCSSGSSSSNAKGVNMWQNVSSCTRYIMRVAFKIMRPRQLNTNYAWFRGMYSHTSQFYTRSNKPPTSGCICHIVPRGDTAKGAQQYVC